jgi:hypothetical protein
MRARTGHHPAASSTTPSLAYSFSEVFPAYIRALFGTCVPAHETIRRRSSAVLRTALTCGQTSIRACSSSLTTSLTYTGGAGAGLGGRVRHGVRAPGSHASRVIVGLVAPHREQRARQTTCEGDDRHLLSAPARHVLRPQAERRSARIRGTPHAPGGLHESRLQGRMRAVHQATSSLFFTRAVLPGARPR